MPAVGGTMSNPNFWRGLWAALVLGAMVLAYVALAVRGRGAFTDRVTDAVPVARMPATIFQAHSSAQSRWPRGCWPCSCCWQAAPSQWASTALTRIHRRREVGERAPLEGRGSAGQP